MLLALLVACVTSRGAPTPAPARPPVETAGDVPMPGTVSIDTTLPSEVGTGGVSPTPAVTWYLDADGDGFGDPDQPRTGSPPPAGTVPDASDCDDAHASVHPGATEVCGDGLENDCDGQSPRCRVDGEQNLSDAPVRFLRDDGHDARGVAILDLGGPNPYVAVSASGADEMVAAYLFDASRSGDLNMDDADYTLLPSAVPLDMMRSIRGARGVGNDSLLVQTNGDHGGAIYLVDPVSVGASLDAGYGSWPTQYARTLLDLGDVEGDGYGDLAFAGNSWDTGTTVYGITAYHGPFSGSYASADADTTWTTTSHLYSAASGHDLDGDGVSDIAFEDASPDGTWDHGYVYLADPTASGTVPESDLGAPVSLSEGRCVGGLDGGDLDGDGYDDLVATCNTQFGETWQRHLAFVFPGPWGAAASSEDAYATVDVAYGDEARQGGASAIFDFDGDGANDLVLGAPTMVDDDLSILGGLAIFYGPVQGTFDWYDGDVHYWGDFENHKPGSKNDLAHGDLNGDGYEDLVVGALTCHGDAACAWILYGGGL